MRAAPVRRPRPLPPRRRGQVDRSVSHRPIRLRPSILAHSGARLHLVAVLALCSIPSSPIGRPLANPGRSAGRRACVGGFVGGTHGGMRSSGDSRSLGCPGWQRSAGRRQRRYSHGHGTTLDLPGRRRDRGVRRAAARGRICRDRAGRRARAHERAVRDPGQLPLDAGERGLNLSQSVFRSVGPCATPVSPGVAVSGGPYPGNTTSSYIARP